MEKEDEEIIISEQIWAECDDILPKEEGIM